MDRRLFPLQMPLRSKEDYQAARNMIANVWQSYGSMYPELTLIIDEPHRTASDRQRKQSHVWFDEIANETGHTAAEVKEFLMSELLSPVEIEIAGKRRTRRRSWTELSREEAQVFMDRVQTWAADNLGVILK